MAPKEGLELNPELLTSFSSFANEVKIPKEKAEAFVEGFYKKQTELAAAQIATWRAEAEADKELGGPDFEKNVGYAKKALKKFGGDEVLKVLETTGLASHKEVIRWAFRVGKAMADDNVATTGNGAPSQEPVTFSTALANASTKANK